MFDAVALAPLTLPATSLDEIERLRLHIERMRKEDETFTEAVGRFADQVYRSSSTVWRWLSGESKIPRKVLRRIP